MHTRNLILDNYLKINLKKLFLKQKLNNQFINFVKDLNLETSKGFHDTISSLNFNYKNIVQVIKLSLIILNQLVITNRKRKKENKF